MNPIAVTVGSTPTRARPLPIAAAAAAIPSAVVAAGISVAAAAAGVPQLPQLTPPAVALFAGIGAVAAVIGWQVVRRRAADPRALLTRLVPSLLLLSFVPDVVLGVLTAADAGVAPALTLAAMHLTTVLITVPVCLRTLPVPTSTAPARSAR